MENITQTEDKYFTFWLDGQLYAIPIGNVVQIVDILPLTAIPEAPHYMKGI
ncbi:chemotaxis protein CheW, partial [Christensenellaceae bacterium OttesenSCG-928-K19]|nr:chemotaxis protein CheW [Christensenellaceae bacterium OttesenSCG-928-K19]